MLCSFEKASACTAAECDDRTVCSAVSRFILCAS